MLHQISKMLDRVSNYMLPEDHPAWIIKPRRVKKGANRRFHNTLLDICPELANLTHEEIEDIKDERNRDIFDD
jgi:hypothetical protein